MVVKRNDLGRFLNKLENVSKINEDNRIIKIIAEKGKEFAEKNWGGRAIITSEISENKCTRKKTYCLYRIWNGRSWTWDLRR